MKALITDTETTGLKVADSVVIELAFILYDTTAKTELYQASTLIYAPANPVEHVNHLSQSSLNAVQNSLIPKAIIELFGKAEEEADCFIAHNAPFDKGFVNAHVIKTTKPWVCSKSDLKFPSAGSGNRLGYLAVDHGIVVTDAHRALGDCRTLLSLLKLTPDLEEQLQNSVLPREWYRANVSYDDRHLAKDAGFSWVAGSKTWEGEFNAEKAKTFTFPVTKFNKKG